jgi:carbonic anhydrase
MVKEGIEKGDLQLIGAFYDIYTGNVEWLGDHPELEEIVGKPLPYWQWKNAKYTRKVNVEYASVNPKVEQAVQRLKRGNERFKEGMGSRSAVTPEVPDPFAIVIGGGEVRVPIEQMFDVQPGELIVQRVMGNIAGRPGGTLVNSIEFALARYDPKLLLVLGDSASRIVKTALEQSTGAQTPSPALRYVVDRVMVSAIRAKKQVEEDLSFTAAGRDLQIQRLTVELNVFYTIEQLLRSSIVRDAVRDGMEMQGAVLNSQTGHVEFIGQHPQLTAVMDDVVYAT